MEAASRIQVLIFIPTYNDRECVEWLCDQALALGIEFQVLIVDDGSDPPIELHHRPGLHLFRQPYNAGLGCSMNIAMDFAHRVGFDVLVRIDADGQHPPSMIPAVMRPVLDGEADVAVGNRLNSFEASSIRAAFAGLLKRHLRFIANAVTGLCIHDWHSGFMAFSTRAISVLREQNLERFPEVEILAAARLGKLTVCEVPVMQDRRRHGQSSLTLLAAIRHVLGVYSILIRHAIRGRRNG